MKRHIKLLRGNIVVVKGLKIPCFGFSGSNNPLASQASPEFTSVGNKQATPASTTKHVVVDSSESIDTSGRFDSSTSDTEDKIGGGDDHGAVTVSNLEFYSIPAIRSVNVFQNSGDKGPLYKGQMFKDKTTLKQAVESYAFVERATMIGDLFPSKYRDLGHIIRLKDIVSKIKEQHDIHLSYNKAYRSKEQPLNQVFECAWESFQRLLSYFYVLKQANPETVTKIKTESQNWFKHGFMAIKASIEGFNYVIKPVICIDATHLKARTRGVLLVVVCKDGNEMIYHLAFGFANSECTESWTWFLKRLRKLI
ncbi:hypothetical protein Ddye_021006 [Dipteronia dyeriana]|uniref:MULE transposase domain-containing protein n=1 Tax=Dipteronia dyeriana TaxID=168575 RepID=A0AAD9WWI0_9ROSI|nr:hypothetical protein Ddye_021006 [Dipteronia dyeriana]